MSYEISDFVRPMIQTKIKNKKSHTKQIKRLSIRPTIQIFFCFYMLENICLVLSTLMCVKIY